MSRQFIIHKFSQLLSIYESWISARDRIQWFDVHSSIRCNVSTCEVNKSVCTSCIWLQGTLPALRRESRSDQRSSPASDLCPDCSDCRCSWRPLGYHRWTPAQVTHKTQSYTIKHSARPGYMNVQNTDKLTCASCGRNEMLISLHTLMCLAQFFFILSKSSSGQSGVISI